MAQRGRPIPATTMTQIQRLRQVLSLRETARETGTSPPTVIKYAGKRPLEDQPTAQDKPGTTQQ